MRRIFVWRYIWLCHGPPLSTLPAQRRPFTVGCCSKNCFPLFAKTAKYVHHIYMSHHIYVVSIILTCLFTTEQCSCRPWTTHGSSGRKWLQTAGRWNGRRRLWRGAGWCRLPMIGWRLHYIYFVQYGRIIVHECVIIAHQFICFAHSCAKMCKNAPFMMT